MTIDITEFKKVLSNFTTGVTIVTSSLNDKEYLGVTISSFSSLSLDPPLVLFCLGKKSYSLGGFLKTKYFTINILAENQQALSDKFARSSIDKWENVEHFFGKITNCPLINGCLGYIECEKYMSYDGGDHIIFIGKVLNLTQARESDPLLRYQSSYYKLGNKL